MRIRTGSILLLLAAAGAAQNERVVPSYCARFEGRGRDQILAGNADMRLQILYAGPAITAKVGLIQAVAFRREGETATAYAAWTVHRRILLDHTAAGPDQLQGTFANNISSNAKNVFESASLVFPALAAPAYPPAPFAVLIPFSQPYLFDAGKGNLIMDVTGQGSTQAVEWHADSHAQNYGTAGLAGELGPGCLGAKGERLDIALDPNLLYVGGTLQASFTHNLASPTAALLWFGRSADLFAGLPLPLDLGFLGATGCSLQAAVELIVAVPAAGGAFPAVTVPLKDPVLGLAEIYLQALASAPAANPAGMVFSAGLKGVIWPAQRPPSVLNCVAATSSTATGGSVSRTPFGAVTKFIGSLP